MALFKRYSDPDGMVLANTNTYFVSVYVGSDSNAGTRDAPFQTINKANTLGGKLILVSGMSTENVANLACAVLGDNSQSGISGNITGSLMASVYAADNLYINGNLYPNTNSKAWINLVVSGILAVPSIGVYALTFKNIFTSKLYYRSVTQSGSISNITMLEYYNFTNADPSSSQNLSNSIIINVVDLYNFTSLTNATCLPLFKYCLFRKLTAWKWNGTTISINWATNPNTSAAYTTETLLERVYQSLLYYANSLSAGTAKTYFLAMLTTNTTIFYADTNGQTNKVVDDSIYPIFNMYNGTTPVDYSLKIDSANVATTMSSSGSYVGAYKANMGGILFGSIVNVNSDGTDDAGTIPTLLVSDGYNQFSANDASIQSRNRIRTIVQSYTRGKAMAGAGSQLTSGLASRIYFGKKRPMVTSGSGLTIPVETFEVIPYDSLPSDNSVGAANDITGKSTFPRFSVAFNGTTQMWYKSNGAPLLFNDLATYSITTDVSLTEYGTWAVTSADAEDYNLSLIATANSLTKKNIPVTYCKQELNLNYV